jgi:hypothetical protein
LVVLDPRFQNGVFLFFFLGELARRRELGLSVVVPFEPVQIVSQLEAEIKGVGVQRDSLGQG